MYAIFYGELYTDGHFVAVFDSKTEAVKAIRKQGYKFDRQQNIFVNYSDKVFNDARFFRIEKVIKNTLF